MSDDEMSRMTRAGIKQLHQDAPLSRVDEALKKGGPSFDQILEVIYGGDKTPVTSLNEYVRQSQSQNRTPNRNEPDLDME